MKVHAVPRWAISLADIMMLLLGFFILLQAGKATDVAAGARAAFSMEPQPRALLTTEAAALFEPGDPRPGEATSGRREPRPRPRRAPLRRLGARRRARSRDRARAQ